MKKIIMSLLLTGIFVLTTNTVFAYETAEGSGCQLKCNCAKEQCTCGCQDGKKCACDCRKKCTCKDCKCCKKRFLKIFRKKCNCK